MSLPYPILGVELIEKNLAFFHWGFCSVLWPITDLVKFYLMRCNQNTRISKVKTSSKTGVCYKMHCSWWFYRLLVVNSCSKLHVLCGYINISHRTLLGIFHLIERQSCHHIETSQLICRPNPLTGFYMIPTLAFNGLRTKATFTNAPNF